MEPASLLPQLGAAGVTVVVLWQVARAGFAAVVAALERNTNAVERQTAAVAEMRLEFAALRSRVDAIAEWSDRTPTETPLRSSEASLPYAVRRR